MGLIFQNTLGQAEDVVEGVNALIKELEEELAAEGLAPGEVEVGVICVDGCICVSRMR